MTVPINDEILEAAIKLIGEAATLLGWDIAINRTGKNGEFINGIIVGHKKYLHKVVKAFAKAEAEIAKVKGTPTDVKGEEAENADDS